MPKSWVIGLAKLAEAWLSPSQHNNRGAERAPRNSACDHRSEDTIIVVECEVIGVPKRIRHGRCSDTNTIAVSCDV
jgi:hypothetical protein